MTWVTPPFRGAAWALCLHEPGPQDLLTCCFPLKHFLDSANWPSLFPLWVGEGAPSLLVSSLPLCLHGSPGLCPPSRHQLSPGFRLWHLCEVTLCYRYMCSKKGPDPEEENLGFTPVSDVAARPFHFSEHQVSLCISKLPLHSISAWDLLVKVFNSLSTDIKFQIPIVLCTE